MRTGVRKATLGAGVERVAVLVAVGHGRRTALAALARCRAPSLNRSSSAPKSLCAARRRHMTPHRVLVVQSNRPLRVAMGHTSDALRSRNSASLAPRPASGRVGYRCASQKTTERLRLPSWVVTQRARSAIDGHAPCDKKALGFLALCSVSTTRAAFAVAFDNSSPIGLYKTCL